MKGIAMTEPMSTHEAHLRLLESWLPLAQHENTVHQWGHAPAELESLILNAAPALRQAQTVLTARFVLWHAHHQQYQQERTA
jgi:hypothetical protein